MSEEKPKQPPLKAPPKQAKSSRESRWIGLLVLGFGVLCILAVGALLYQNMYGAPAAPQTVDEAQTQQQAATYAEQRRQGLSDSLNRIGQEQKPQQQEKPAVEGGQLQGAWEAILENRRTGIMDITGSSYRMIIASDNSNDYRYYSNGTYKIIEDNIVIFSPDLSIGKPDDGFKYRPIYTTPFSVQAERQGEYMIFSRSPATSAFPNPPGNIFLGMAKDSLMIWKKF